MSTSGRANRGRRHRFGHQAHQLRPARMWRFRSDGGPYGCRFGGGCAGNPRRRRRRACRGPWRVRRDAAGTSSQVSSTCATSRTAPSWPVSHAPTARRRYDRPEVCDECGGCGGRGIRTPEPLAGLAVFKTAPINRSGIPPREYPVCHRGRWDGRRIAIPGSSQAPRVGRRAAPGGRRGTPRGSPQSTSHRASDGAPRHPTAPVSGGR